MGVSAERRVVGDLLTAKNVRIGRFLATPGRAWGNTMRKLLRPQSQTAGPGWGLAFGALMTGVAIVLWWYAKASGHSGEFDEALVAASILIGAFSAAYAAREIHQKNSDKNALRGERCKGP